MLNLGLTEYRSRVLAALFVLGPSTAREISEASGVPRPKVYEILKWLVEEGIVEVQYGKPMIYIPIDVTEFLERVERKYRNSLSSLKRSLESVGKGEVTRPVYTSTIVGERGVLGKLKETLLQAKRRIYIALVDPRILEKVKEILKACQERGVRVICIAATREKKVLASLRSMDLEIYSLNRIKEKDSPIISVLEIMHQERLIIAVNVDGNGIYFVFELGTLVGVWIGIRVLAKIQEIMLKEFFRIRREIKKEKGRSFPPPSYSCANPYSDDYPHYDWRDDVDLPRSRGRVGIRVGRGRRYLRIKIKTNSVYFIIGCWFLWYCDQRKRFYRR